MSLLLQLLPLKGGEGQGWGPAVKFPALNLLGIHREGM